MDDMSFSASIVVGSLMPLLVGGIVSILKIQDRRYKKIVAFSSSIVGALIVVLANSLVTTEQLTAQAVAQNIVVVLGVSQTIYNLVIKTILDAKPVE
jgi:uncharacterized membrane protein YeaQ/YmgE (transglycosylase-associated protein family)